jgi:hypothetical protein
VLLNPTAGYVLGTNCNDPDDPLGEGADIVSIPVPSALVEGPAELKALLVFEREEDAQRWADQNAPEYQPIEADTEELAHLLDWFLENDSGAQVAAFCDGEDAPRIFSAFEFGLRLRIIPL